MVGELRSIPTMSLVPSPTNPRKFFDKTKIQELAHSLGKQGMLQPIVARPMPFGKVPRDMELDLFDEFWEIIAGERRYRAAQFAGLKEVPVIVTEMSDAEVIEAQVVENSQRADVTPLEEADAFAMLLELPEYRDDTKAVDALALKIGKSSSFVYQRLKLRSLGKEARELVANGSMSASVAVDIARLQPKDQTKACKGLYAAGGEVTLVTARAWIRGNLMLRVDDFPFDTTDALLLPMAGACSTCPKNTAVDPLTFNADGAGKKGLCTDPGCYQAKLAAREAQLLAELREKHGASEVVIVTSTYQTAKRKDTLTREKYEKVSERTAGAKIALDVEPSWGGDMFRVFHVLPIEGKPLAGDQDKLAKQGQKIASMFRANLLNAIVEVAPPTIANADLRRFLRISWKRLGRECQKKIATELGVEASVDRWGGKSYNDVLDPWINSMGEDFLSKLIIRMTAATELIVETYSSTQREVPPILGDLAQAYDVDALQFLEDAEETLKPRRLKNLLGEEAKAAKKDCKPQSLEPARPTPSPEPSVSVGELLDWARRETIKTEPGDTIELEIETFVALAKSFGQTEGDEVRFSGRVFVAAEGGLSYPPKPDPVKL